MTINEQREAMLLHDLKLPFTPAWVEFARDGRGIRFIADDGRELQAELKVDKAADQALNNVNDILIVWMVNGKAQEGHVVTFVNQYYDSQRPAGSINEGAWNYGDD